MYSLLCCLLVGLSVLCGIARPASATEDEVSWYQLELIVFGYPEANYDGEIWYENPGLPSRQDSIQLLLQGGDTDAAEPDSLIPYLALPPRYYRLAGIVRVLKKSADHQLLLHVVWQQPGLQARLTRAVHLDNALFIVPPEPPESSEPSEPSELSEPPDTEGIVTEPIFQAPETIYDGTIRLRTARFIHIDLDFSFFPQQFIEKQQAAEKQQVAKRARRARRSATPLPPANPGNRQYADYVRLTESRRIKLDEIHYFDHPLFGLILQVSRLPERSPESQP
ncbi:MAG: CsiV family protein [Gammaproteobacteria bacterium]